MRNDDVIQSIRFILNINDKEIADIVRLGGYQPTRHEIAHIFEGVDEESHKRDTSDELMAHFLDGLIYHKRGKSDKHPQPPIQIPVTNNMILKKLRVAFTLREEDMHDIINSVGFSVSKPEMSALFRKEDHKNYRECGDQMLRYFLKGLAKKYRGIE